MGRVGFAYDFTSKNMLVICLARVQISACLPRTLVRLTFKLFDNDVAWIGLCKAVLDFKTLFYEYLNSVVC
jgi:hypothetical protein